MDSDLFETIKNGIFEKKNYISFEYKISCPDLFGGHFVNLTCFWPKGSRKVQNTLGLSICTVIQMLVTIYGYYIKATHNNNFVR
jgi:hypothetical protein